MARQFDGAADYLERTGAIFSGPPFTWAAWFRPDVVGRNHAIVIEMEAGTNFEQMFHFRVASTDVVQFNTRATVGSQIAETTTTVSANTWHHGTAVCAALDDKRVFLDGGGKGTNATSPGALTPDTTTIGSAPHTTREHFWDGRIAEVVMWDVALSDAEVAIVSRAGFPQHRYRPGNIVAYWRIGHGSPEADLSGSGNAMTVTGTTQADHVPLAPPFGYGLGWRGAFAEAAAGLSIPVAMASYRQRRV